MGDWRKKLSKAAQEQLKRAQAGDPNIDQVMKDYHTVSSDNTGGKNPHLARMNKGKTLKGTHYSSKAGMTLAAAPFVIAAAPAVTAASDAAMGTAVGKAVGATLANPVTKAVGTSIFGGIGLNNFLGPEGYRKTNKAWAEKRYGDWAKSLTGDILDLSMTAPVFNTAYKGYNAFKQTNILKQQQKNIEDIIKGEESYLHPFIGGTKPVYALVQNGYGAKTNTVNFINNLLKDYHHIDLQRSMSNGAQQTLRYFINEPRLKSTIDSYKNFYTDRLGLPKTYTTQEIYDYLLQNPKILDLNITNPLDDVVGVTLGYGPKDAILFKHNYALKNPSKFIETMQLYNYDKTLPGIYNILKKHVQNGTLQEYSTITNGGHIGFRYSPPQFKINFENDNTVKNGGLLSSIIQPFKNFSTNVKFARNNYVSDILNPIREANYSNWLRVHPDSNEALQQWYKNAYNYINPKVSLNPFKYVSSSDSSIGELLRGAAYTMPTNDIYINPKILFKSNDFFKRILAHETQHPFQTTLVGKKPLSQQGTKYFVPNKNFEHYQYLKPFEYWAEEGSWKGSPDELDAEMMSWKLLKGEQNIPFNSLSKQSQDYYVGKARDAFDIDSYNMRRILNGLSKLGYFNNGGKLIKIKK